MEIIEIQNEIVDEFNMFDSWMEKYEYLIDLGKNIPKINNENVAETLPIDVEEKVKTVAGVKSAKVEITFEPPWSQELMSDEAKLELGML